MRIIADFETTTEKTFELEGLTRAWCWCMVDIDTSEIIHKGLDIDEFFNVVFTLDDSDIYFHNLKFDGSFIEDYILRKGFNKYYAFNPKGKNYGDSGSLKNPTRKTGNRVPMYDSLISDMGVWYNQKFCFNKDKKTGKLDLQSEACFTTINFYNSYLKIPAKVKDIPKAYGLEVFKGDCDFDKFREVGYQPTEDEWSYVERDCIIVGKALKNHFNEGLVKLTLASDALHTYKNMIGNALFNSRFPRIDTRIYYGVFQPAYRGGFTYVNPKFQDILIPEVITYDVCSMYPHIMKHHKLPCGDFIYHEGAPTEEEDYYVICVELWGGVLAANRPAIIQESGISSEYVEEFDYKLMYLTHEDWRLIQDCYMIDSYNIRFTVYFPTTEIGMFDEYIDHYIGIKNNGEGAKRQIAKLMLNSLYGKFGTNPDKSKKIAYIDIKTNTVKYKIEEKEDEETMYIPIAIFVCSFARAYLTDAIIANFDRFIYCDTDSIHLVGHEPAKKMDIFNKTIHCLDEKLGMWEEEGKVTDAYYIRSKTYTYLKNGERTVKCAGMPDNLKECVTLENFKVGLTLPGKLMPVRVPGGVILQSTNFTIK